HRRDARVHRRMALAPEGMPACPELRRSPSLRVADRGDGRRRATRADDDRGRWRRRELLHRTDVARRVSLARGDAMTAEKAKKAGDKSVLSYLNLSSQYERKARLLPGLLCAMALAPVGAAYGTPLGDWIALVATGLGLWAVCGVGLSHLASAAGNRYQEKLWPRWPYDAPTNRWLHPED